MLSRKYRVNENIRLPQLNEVIDLNCFKGKILRGVCPGVAESKALRVAQSDGPKS
jgi:hypothetical protein